MTRVPSRPSAVALVAGLALLAGCTHGGPKPIAAPPAAPRAIDRPAEIQAIVGLLDKGEVTTARRRIDALLATDPTDAEARVLDDSLTGDPVQLLGPKSFAYTVRPGETMLALSERFLGNRLKSYQLARYNDIAVPDTLAAGTMLRIPGIAPKPPAPAARSRPKGTSKAKATEVRKDAGATAASTAPKIDAAGAQRARAAGLAALAQGHVASAVVSLRRAAALNPDDALIQRDLGRAERIARTVGTKR